MMSIRQILLAAAILCLAVDLAPAEAELTICHQVSPGEIWSLESDQTPNTSRVTLSLKGDGTPDAIPTEVVLAIDSSGSMEDNDPDDERLRVAKSFVDKMDQSKYRVGLVSWDEDIDFSVPLTDDFAHINDKIGDVDHGEGTNLDRGLRKSIDLLAGGESDVQYIILLSDGDGDYTPSGMQGSQADRAREEGITIHTIGLKVGGTAAEESLKDMASATGGRYYDAPDSDALESIYEVIGKDVMNVAGRDVQVKYVVPADLSIGRYSIAPESEKVEGDFKVLTWDVGTIYLGDVWSTSFEVGSQRVGTFVLGRSSGPCCPDGPESVVTSLRYGGEFDSVPIESRRLRVVDFSSGVSMEIEVSVDFEELYEKMDAIHDVVENDDSHIVWKFTESTDDLAFVFEDGRVFVTSKSEFGLETKDILDEELNKVVDSLNAVGGNLSEYDWRGAMNSAVYYAQDPGIYHSIKYCFGGDFDLNLVVPECSIKEARFIVKGEEYDSFFGKADQTYYIDGENVTSCEYHGFPWNGSCAVDDADITDKIHPGETQKVSASEISDLHTMIIDVITTSEPTKKFLLYSDDLTSVWTFATRNTLYPSSELPTPN